MRKRIARMRSQRKMQRIARNVIRQWRLDMLADLLAR